MKYLKFSIAMLIGIPLGLFVITGAVLGMVAASFQGGWNIMAPRWLDKLNEWMD